MADSSKVRERDGLLTEFDDEKHEEIHVRQNHSSEIRKNRLFIGLLSASIISNIVLLLCFLLNTPTISEVSSKYAKLRRDYEEPYVKVTSYSSSNQSLQDELWNSINVDHGVVALPDSWVAEHGLRTAQRFPWDQTKGVYLLHGFHDLHCLKVIHISLSEHRRGVSQSRSAHHIDHCMDALRRQVLCDADDTPRATELRPEVVSGVWQRYE